MIDPLDGNGGLGGEDIPAEPVPELVAILRGQRAEIQEKMVAMVREQYGIDPKTFTGSINGDPRSVEIYPDNPANQVDLLTGDSTNLIAEEFQMQFQMVEGLRVDTLPPKPLTPTDLDDLLQRLASHCGIDESEYEAWVPIEPEIIDETAVGEYRATVPGSIIRFHLETGGAIATFALLPCYETDIGFAWYSLGVTDADDGLLAATIESEEAQRLSGLLTSDGDRLLETTPDRIRNASNLLGTVLHSENPSPTPDGWIVTECKRDDDASELLAPRYTGTFVHKETDIVLEVLPEPADAPLRSNNAEVDRDLSGMAISNPNDSDTAYRWNLSFAPDDVHDDLTDSFDEHVAGKDFNQIMAAVNVRVE